MNSKRSEWQTLKEQPGNQSDSILTTLVWMDWIVNISHSLWIRSCHQQKPTSSLFSRSSVLLSRLSLTHTTSRINVESFLLLLRFSVVLRLIWFWWYSQKIWEKVDPWPTQAIATKDHKTQTLRDQSSDTSTSTLTWLTSISHQGSQCGLNGSTQSFMKSCTRLDFRKVKLRELTRI